MNENMYGDWELDLERERAYLAPRPIFGCLYSLSLVLLVLVTLAACGWLSLMGPR